MTKPRISVVQYLNTAPLVWGMLHGAERGKFDLEFTTPARCADAVAQGRADVGIVPSIEVPRIDGAEIVPGVCIASKGLVKSVLLLSQVPIEEIRSVAMDNSSRTSAALVTVLLRRFYGLDFRSEPADPQPEEMLKRVDAALLIGDPALAYQLKVETGNWKPETGNSKLETGNWKLETRFDNSIPACHSERSEESLFVTRAATLFVYDLAAEWKKFTSLPFVFALWAGRPEAGLAEFVREFQESRDQGLRHLDAIASEWAPRLELTESAVKLYLAENINYDLDEENLAGLRLFYKLAAEEGLTPAGKELRFVSQTVAMEL
ncbi:MAG TPA: menaquinone biosynthesis protein [Terriglobia bacterium]|nr:menaquinone biosynthesis protein [Terriglobia bacterium]